ncbi:MAG TPA: hypothetical protein VGU27_09655 [Candidatus Eisenbacteria bacterium]|nr:hypothetical protein [Candidatus Eisenbacteria bacterium]
MGLGACAGCQTPVCMVLNGIRVATSTPLAGTDVVVTGAADAPNSDFVSWQGGGSPTTIVGTGCPAAVPTHNATWGAVKAMYR